MAALFDRIAGRNRQLTMAGSKRVARDLEDPKNTFPWGKTPKGVPPARVKFLSIYDDISAPQRDLPPNFAAFANVVVLGMPIHLIAKLPSVLPPSLRMLIVYSGAALRAALPAHLQLPKLEALLAPDVMVSFDPVQVPNLRMLSVKVAKPAELEGLAKLTKLEALSIGPIPDAKIFKLLAKHPLQTLTLMRGSLTKLAGIEALSRVSDLTVKGMPKLVDISAIKGLRSLRTLSLEFCPQLGDPRFLAKTKLKTLVIWGCSDKKQTIRRALPALVAAKIVIDSEILDDLEDEDDDDDDDDE